MLRTYLKINSKKKTGKEYLPDLQRASVVNSEETEWVWPNASNVAGGGGGGTEWDGTEAYCTSFLAFDLEPPMQDLFTENEVPLTEIKK